MKRLAKRVPIGLTIICAVVAGGGYVLFSGWPNDRPPPIARGVITKADWLKWDEAGGRLTVALNKRFPIGSSESDLRAELVHERFILLCPDGYYVHKYSNGNEETCMDTGDARRNFVYRWGGLPCDESVQVKWLADNRGRITHIEGGYGGGCI